MIGRFLAALLVGIVFTIVGFRFGTRVLHAPVWVASWMFAHLCPRATNAVQNLTYVLTNIASWTLVWYLAIKLVGHRKAS